MIILSTGRNKSSGLAGAMLLSLAVISFFGCAMSVPQARYSAVPQVSVAEAKGSLFVGPFLDKRTYSMNFSTEHLGTVRGGFGNVLKRVTDGRGADEFVREQVINVARSTAFIADGAPGSLTVKDDGSLDLTSAKGTPPGRPVLIGVIHTLAVETLVQRTVDVDLDLALVDPLENKPVWKQHISAHDSNGLGAGISEDVGQLKGWLAKVVQDETEKYFSAAEFQRTLAELSKKTEDKLRNAVFPQEGAASSVQERTVLPAGDFFYHAGTDHQKMRPAEVTSKTSHRRLFIPVAGAALPPEDFVFIAGEHASLTIAGKRPAFHSRIRPELIKLVHLEFHKGEKSRFVVFENYRSKKQVLFGSEAEAEGIYRIVPAEELAPGEYAFIVGGNETAAYDFAIR